MADLLSPSTSGASRYYRWYVVGLLAVVGGLNYGDRGALLTVFPMLRADLKMSDLQLAAIGTIFLWSYAIASPLAGFVGDRYCRSKVIAFSVSAWSVVTLLTSLCTSPTQLLGMRACLGVVESLYLPAAVALLADHHDSRTSGRAMSLHTCGTNLGFVAGGILSAHLAQRHGWRFSLSTLGIVGLIVGLVCRFTLRDSKPVVSKENTSFTRQAPSGRNVAKIFSVPSVVTLLAEGALLAAGTWILNTWLPLYFSERFHAHLDIAAAYGTFPTQMGEMLGIFAGGWVSDFFARRAPSRRMLLHSICYLIAAPALLGFIWFNNPAALAASLFLYSSIRLAGYANAMPLLCDLLNRGERATAIGVINSSNCIVAGAAVLVAGSLKQRLGLTNVFVCLPALILCAALLLLFTYIRFLPRDLSRAAAARSAAEESGQKLESIASELRG